MNGHGTWLWRAGLLALVSVAAWLIDDKVHRLDATLSRVAVETRAASDRLTVLETAVPRDREILLEVKSDVREIRTLLERRAR